MRRTKVEISQLKPLAFEMLRTGTNPTDVGRELELHRTTVVRWMRSKSYEDYLAGHEPTLEIPERLKPKKKTERAHEVIHAEALRKSSFLKALRATGRIDVAATYVAATPDDVYRWTVTESDGYRAKAETFLKIAGIAWQIADSPEAKPLERLRALELILKNSDWRTDAPAVAIEIKPQETADGRTPAQVMIEGLQRELSRFEDVDLLNVVDVTA